MSQSVFVNGGGRLAQIGTCHFCNRARRVAFVVSNKTLSTLSSLSTSNQYHSLQALKHRNPLRFPAVLSNPQSPSRHITTTTFSAARAATALVRHGWGRRSSEKNPQPAFEVLTDHVKESFNSLKQEQRPVITIPVNLERRLEKKMEKDNTKRAIRQRIIDASRKGGRGKSQIIISCKRPEFNHYVGQSYDKREDIPLASDGWDHKKSAQTQDFFTLFPGLKKESPFYMSETSKSSFSDLGICQQLCDNLNRLGVTTPTHIQVFGIPHLLKEANGRTVVAAETGCGKTLVYLLPVIQQILEERRSRSPRIRPKPGYPSVIILVPSRELADQIYSVVQELTQNLEIDVKLLQGGNLRSKVRNPPQNKIVDILITTANALKVLSSAGVYHLGRITHVVLDEADTLLDDSFFPELVGPFLNRLPWTDIQRDIQLTLVSATMPTGLKSTLGEIMKVDDFNYCTTPGLHHLLPHVPQTFIRIQPSRKPEKIIELLMEDEEQNRPVVVFCNRSQTCTWLSHYLTSEGISCVGVHGRMPLRYRVGRIEMYIRGEVNVLVATDLASRGIDTIRTQHVINYEFPLFMADYIHRCGRTGRVGSAEKCRVTSLVQRRGEVQTVREIEASVRKEARLPDVNANIKKLYHQKYGSFVEIDPIGDDDDDIGENPDDSVEYQ